MLWKEGKREEISFLLSLDDVCRMKQFSVELVGKQAGTDVPEKVLDFRKESGEV